MTTHYGIIGCGMMGQEHIRNIRLLDDTSVSAIYEPNAEMGQRSASLAPDAIFFDSIDRLLAHKPLDCLVIASPNHLHLEQLEQIAANVALPILVEKPLFTDPADLARVQALKDNYKAPIWVAMEYRYMPPMQLFLKQVEDVTGGIKMLSVIEHRFPFLEKVGDWNRFNKNSGGTFVEKCCHFFDLMRVILQSDPTRVMASAGQEVNHLTENYGGVQPDILDSGFVIVDFANGTRAMLELSMYAEGSEYQEMVHAIGPSGKLEVQIPGPARLWSGDPDKHPIPRVIQNPRFPCAPVTIHVPIDETLLDAGDHNGSTFHQHEKFLDVVLGQGEVEVTLDDGIWAVRMGQAAQHSAMTGKAIDL